MKKFSRKREAILNTVCSTKTHPTVEWVYMKMKPEYPDLSLATVYRNMSAFIKEGRVKSVGVVDGQERFDGNTADHPHFICDSCGDVTDVEVDGNHELSEEVGRLYNFSVRCQEITFRGLCGKCMASHE